MSQATIHDVTAITTSLDHAECLNFGPDGACYAGGEDGQVYRFQRNEPAEIYARTGGGIGGVCLDAGGALYACNYVQPVVQRVSPSGEVSVYSAGTDDRPAREPNYGIFDADGFYYYSDSGSYYHPNGRLFTVTPTGETKFLFGDHMLYPNGLAIDPTGAWLYVIQSTAPDILRFPIESNDRLGDPEIYVKLHSVVPDGMAFAESGNLYIACYTPDVILRVRPNRSVSIVVEDVGSDVLNRPTNVAFEPGTTNLWFVNFGGHSVGSLDVGEPGVSRHWPQIP